MERIAFTMRVKPDEEAEYRRRHESVWPDMLRAFKDAGYANYSIFVDGRDLFAYMEVDDFARFECCMSASPEAQRREAYMAPIVQRGIQPGTGFHKVLPEVFHLV